MRIDIRGESQPIDQGDAEDYAEGEWVENSTTGKMEWHNADGTVVSADEWEQGGAEDAAETEAVAEVVADAEVEADAEVADTEIESPTTTEAEGDVADM